MVLAIIQARMASTRLPGKVLKPIMGRPMISLLLERLTLCKRIDKVVVATTESQSDDELVKFLQESHIAVFRGAENDVLDRFFQCASAYRPDVIVRVTADDPLKDPELIDKVIGELNENPGLDYCSNTICPSYPEGIDIEVFRFEALRKAHSEAISAADREHVTPFIWSRPDRFSLKNMAYSEDISSWRLTVDKPQDFALITKIFEELYPKNPRFGLTELVSFLKKNPELLRWNAGTVRNEGYLKSLKESES